MARIKGGMNAKRKHNKVLKLAKGYRGSKPAKYTHPGTRASGSRSPR